MAQTQAAPVAPAPEGTTPPAEDTRDLRPLETVSLDDATPPPPAEDTPDVTTGRKPNRHDQVMAGIVAARHRVLEKENAYAREIGLGGEPEPQPEPVPQPQETRPAPGADQPAPQPTPAPAVAADPPAAEPIRTHRIVVRNQPIDVPEADLIRLAERGVASEARIREANQILEQAQRLHGSAPQPDTSARPSPPAAPAPASQPSPSVDRNAALEIARIIQYGDENEVADAILRIAPQSQQAPPVDPEAIARHVQQRVDNRLWLERELTTFAGEYSDIVNDAPLTTLAGQYVNQLRDHYQQTGTQKAEPEIWREAADAVRQDVRRWIGATAPQPAPQPAPAPAGPSARTAIKRNTPNAPAAAAAISTTPATRPKTGKDIVNDMRRARGQPVYA